jgi:hypothetical protein
MGLPTYLLLTTQVLNHIEVRAKVIEPICFVLDGNVLDESGTVHTKVF